MVKNEITKVLETNYPKATTPTTTTKEATPTKDEINTTKETTPNTEEPKELEQSATTTDNLTTAAANRGKSSMMDLSSEGQVALEMLSRHFDKLTKNKISCMPSVKPGDIANTFAGWCFLLARTRPRR